MNTFKKVWNLTLKIPKGKVTTYGEIARKININPRVVGYALHANKNHSIPCHRVVNRMGKIAKNYGFGGFLEQRQRLLNEGVEFKDEMHVVLKEYLFKFSG